MVVSSADTVRIQGSSQLINAHLLKLAPQKFIHLLGNESSVSAEIVPRQVRLNFPIQVTAPTTISIKSAIDQVFGIELSMEQNQDQSVLTVPVIWKIRPLSTQNTIKVDVDLSWDESLEVNQIAQKELSLDAQKLLQQREVARKSGDFSQSDQLRNELVKLGIAVKDSKSGQSWDWIIN